MYYDAREHRVLYRDGQSVMSDFDVALQILRGEESLGKVAASEDAATYNEFYGENIEADLEFQDPEPKSHKHTQEDFRIVLDAITRSPRLELLQPCYDRIERELDYFERTENIFFLIELIKMVEHFQKEGIVWGVGRGSSCSSYVLYLLEVNDINPMLYNIPFSELSKEQEID